ncbi:hypothetical protein [Mycolicibacterium sphagni]|uniref:hypothetical protein n=1 Tax=Mycolicibacterium sphagni TaxID=1786 RepID=UPI0021F34E69|nr:hypothetical protein [Mycolicibacterium sphagni]MCV7174862.1 hypothetical protein [Mycolicibacterium sphagni]
MKITDRRQLAALPVGTVIQSATGEVYELTSRYPPDRPWEWLYFGMGSEMSFTQKAITLPAWTMARED